MHPNCRHEFIPFVEEMYAQEELQALIEKSNHFKELSPDDKLFKIYNENQALLRQWNEERHEFNRLKATLGDQMPYTTLGGFRRARRANTEQYEKTKERVRNYEIAEKDKQIVDFYKKKGYNNPQ